ncbi:hypothetical protein [Lysinibacillus sp. Y5S-8]|uniref:hypothetical protein n=1 Tax=Lysinibacillus sp. Y5S-8 TaxID=3122488 RepID=UPI0030D48C9A
MSCITRRIELPVPVPQTKLDICRIEKTINIGGNEQKISYDVPCIKTRICEFKINVELCYPNLPEVANKVLGKAIAQGAKIAAMSVITALEPTAEIAINAFTQGFTDYVNKQGEDIKKQFTDVTTNTTLDANCGPWKNI